MSEERLYAVRLLWIRDQNLFAQYQELAKRIIARFGVHIERWLITDSLEGEGMEKPDEIVVTWFPNRDAKVAFETDPEFVEAAKLRDKAAKLITVTGSSVFGD